MVGTFAGIAVWLVTMNTENGKKMMNWKINLIALITTLILAASTMAASATTIYVPDNYTTIQEAVNASNNEDLIIVRDETYTENVIIKNSLTIRSENGSVFTTIIAADSDLPVFWVKADYVNINGFTVKGGTADKWPLYTAGIFLSIGSDYCNISNNNASYNGDGIWLVNSSNNMIANNIANLNSNHGIHLFSICDNNILINNTVTSNNMTGIELSGSNNNMIVNNTASGNDRGICLFDSSNNILLGNNVSNNNYGSYHYGIYLLKSRNNNLTNNIISNNDYGAYLLKSRNNNLTNNIISNNDHGIYMISSNSSVIHPNNFINNKENICYENRVPGFEAVFTIVGLLVIAYLVRRKK